MFLGAPGYWADLAAFVGLAALACAGVLFMWAAVPHRQQQPSSRWMLIVLLTTYTLYFGLLVIDPVASWALTPAAVAHRRLAARHFAVDLAPASRIRLRWTIVGLNLALSIFLLIFQHRPDMGPIACLRGGALHRLSWLRHPFLVHLQARNRGSLHHHRRLLCLG